MNVTDVRRLILTAEAASKVLGPEASLRQLLTLLYVTSAGEDGMDSTTVERRTQASQAATSRNLRSLSVGFGLIEFQLDPYDGRRRIAKACPKGKALVKKMLEAATP